MNRRQGTAFLRLQQLNDIYLSQYAKQYYNTLTKPPLNNRSNYRYETKSVNAGRGAKFWVITLITLVIFILCACGSVWQTYHITDMFFKYPTTIELEMETPKHVAVPGITICRDIKSTLLKKEFYQKFPKVKENVSMI